MNKQLRQRKVINSLFRYLNNHKKGGSINFLLFTPRCTSQSETSASLGSVVSLGSADPVVNLGSADPVVNLGSADPAVNLDFVDSAVNLGFADSVVH